MTACIPGGTETPMCEWCTSRGGRDMPSVVAISTLARRCCCWIAASCSTLGRRRLSKSTPTLDRRGLTMLSREGGNGTTVGGLLALRGEEVERMGEVAIEFVVKAWTGMPGREVGGGLPTMLMNLLEPERDIPVWGCASNPD